MIGCQGDVLVLERKVESNWYVNVIKDMHNGVPTRARTIGGETNKFLLP